MSLHPVTLLSDNQAAAAQARLAILPLGALEAHGAHLALGTDLILAERLLDAAAALLPPNAPAMLRLPALWLGASVEHTATPGTFSQTHGALHAQIEAVAAGLPALGVDRLLLFNAHGGNQAVAENAAFSVRARHGMLVAACHWTQFGLPEGLSPPAPEAGDIHGGWRETALMLHLAPQGVQLPLATEARADAPSPMLSPGGRVRWGWMTQDLTGGRHAGAPTLATPALGEALTTHIAQQLCALMLDLATCRWTPA